MKKLTIDETIERYEKYLSWNGLNQYVYDWLEKNFDAVCNCPLAVQKTQSDDDWSSHIYTLDKDKVLEFAGIEKEKDEREL